jgi:hypothetical protein
MKLPQVAARRINVALQASHPHQEIMMIDRNLRTVLSFTFLYGAFALSVLAAQVVLASVPRDRVQTASVERQTTTSFTGLVSLASYDLASSE